MNEHLKIWDKVKQPPPHALKQIRGGRLSGMTDIKPQWRTQVMTEIFGPCGTGWKYEIKNLWTLPGAHEQVFAFADIDLYYKVGDTWSEPIPGHGGSMLVTKEKGGLHSSDEGFKMAITDALSTAMKAIGVASDIYMGNWDGSKYINREPINGTPKRTVTLGKENLKWLSDFCTNRKMSPEDKEAFKTLYQFDPYQTTDKQFEKIKAQILEDHKEPA